jgi:predicted Zn finger-like uncharacterized protein
MIVTCPGCSSKYRVRNETVPAEGARMRCPKCETLFLAKPPDASASPTEPTTLPPLAVSGAPTTGASPSPFASVPPSSSFAPTGTPTFGAQGLFGNSGPVPPAPGPGVGGGPFATPSTGSGTVPPAPRPQGPLTMMMQGIDDATLKAAQAATSPPTASAAPTPTRPRTLRPGEDPFANIVLDHETANEAGPPRPVMPLRVAHTEPTAMVRVAPVRPSLAAEAASWAFVTAAGFAAVFGAVFAGWTSEALDLDGALLPVFERRFGVTPPRSFIGRDDVPLETLRQQAVAAEGAGDLAAAAVAWLEVRENAPDDPAAVAAVPRLLGALGEPRH